MRLAVTPNSRTRDRLTVSGALTLPQAYLSLGPLGYWKLDETTRTSGSTATDSSGNGRHGTFDNAASGTWANAVGPDGVNYADFGNTAATYVVIADNNVWSVDTAPGLTIFALIKPDSVAGTTRQFIVAKGSGGGGVNYEWGFQINTAVAGRIDYGVNGGPGNALQNEGVNSVLGTAWQAVAFTTPDANFNTRGVLYRNSGSALSATQGSTNNANAYVNGSSTVRIGWRTDDPAGQYFQGGIAHVAIFSGQMSAPNVTTIMDAAHRDGWF